ncbi:uncharacterized protein TM35_000121430 [Trypanosoma theileri]|uniref:Uncharacterized protein n=1 Tax=Trypanosoma theileri TaxID=67003 RepID=A0A1X0NXU2_9TRYP|nr:uncharacterized protein TM35_000121430 [Trypanosoma theileri]ORC89368.1 hypothetical protein TM35_000121430 [Trypanosoma theileri]
MKEGKVYVNLGVVGLETCSCFVFSRALILLLLLIGCVERNPGPVQSSENAPVCRALKKCDGEVDMSVDNFNKICDSECMDAELVDSSEDEFDDDNWLEVDFGELSLTDKLVNSSMKSCGNRKSLSPLSSRGKSMESGRVLVPTVQCGRKKRQNVKKRNHSGRQPFVNNDISALHRALVRQLLPWRPAQKLSEVVRNYADIVVCMEFLVKVHKKRCRFLMLDYLSKYRRRCKVISSSSSSSNPVDKTSSCDVPGDNNDGSSRNKPMEEKEFRSGIHTTTVENTINPMESSEGVNKKGILYSEEIITDVPQNPNDEMKNPFLLPCSVDYSIPKENLKTPKSCNSFWMASQGQYCVSSQQEFSAEEHPFSILGSRSGKNYCKAYSGLL